MADKQSDINDKYPILSYRYNATIEGEVVPFSEISGLNMEYETAEYKEAGEKTITTMHQLGQRNAPTITMKRGIFKKQLALYEWFNSAHTENFTKKQVIITLIDNDGNAIMTWTLENAFCTKFEGPGLDAKSNEVTFQSIDLKGDTLLVADAG